MVPCADDMDAALALTGLFTSDPAPPLAEGDTHAEDTRSFACAAAHETPDLGSARFLTCLPDMTHGWPFADGKGCFGKDRQGKELPFLERLFLLLAFPNLELPGQPGRTLGEAIRWKRADQLAALGLPAGTAAFEIVDVPLVEAAVYPQYASGSFNKTCAKWGLYSPATKERASRDPTWQTGAPSKRLSRECICVPAAHPNLRQLAATATAADVYRHAALVAAPRASSTPAVAPGRIQGAAAAAAPSAASPGAPMDPDTLARVVAAVRSMPDVPALSSDQLHAILDSLAKPSPPNALVAKRSPPNAPVASAASATAPAPAPSPITLEAAPAATPAKPGPAPLQWQTTQYAQGHNHHHQARSTPGSAPGAPPVLLSGAVSGGAAVSRKRARAGMQWGDLHVALWDKEKRQRVPSKAYSGDIHSYLAENPHLEVYNHQDVAAKAGSQLLAGQKLTQVTNPTDGAARVVLWDTQAQCKLPSAECPTPAGLCAFLRTHSHSHLEVWSGQQPPPTPPPLPSTAAAADVILKGAKAAGQMLTSPLPLAGPKLEAAAPPLKPKSSALLSGLSSGLVGYSLTHSPSRWVRTVGL